MIFVCWLDKNAWNHRFFRIVADLNLFRFACCFGFGLGLGFADVLGLGVVLTGIAFFSGTFGSYFNGATSSLCY